MRSDIERHWEPVLNCSAFDTPKNVIKLSIAVHYLYCVFMLVTAQSSHGVDAAHLPTVHVAARKMPEPTAEWRGNLQRNCSKTRDCLCYRKYANSTLEGRPLATAIAQCIDSVICAVGIAWYLIVSNTKFGTQETAHQVIGVSFL